MSQQVTKTLIFDLSLQVLSCNFSSLAEDRSGRGSRAHTHTSLLVVTGRRIIHSGACHLRGTSAARRLATLPVSQDLKAMPRPATLTESPAPISTLRAATSPWTSLCSECRYSWEGHTTQRMLHRIPSNINIKVNEIILQQSVFHALGKPQGPPCFFSTLF